MAYIGERQEPVIFRVICPPGGEAQLILAKEKLGRSGIKEIEERDLQLQFSLIPERLEDHRDRLKELFHRATGVSSQRIS
jgi:hypothetical protein